MVAAAVEHVADAQQHAGAATVVREFYAKGRGVADPSAALIKATLINTAVDITGYGYAGYEAALPIPNPHEGWGRINVGEAVTVGAGQFKDNGTGISTGTIAQWNIEVVANTKPFKALVQVRRCSQMGDNRGYESGTAIIKVRQ